MKAILLAGGFGTRLYPITQSISKHLLPIYDKPMIYYPLSTLMLAGLRDILLISTYEDYPLYQKLLANGAQWGLNISYAQQSAPQGIPQALTIGEDFLAGDSVCLMLGDNILWAPGLSHTLQQASKITQGATIFAYHVQDPERYGVIEFDTHGHAHDIIEKPNIPPSNYAVIGLYFYDATAPQRAKQLTPSARGEFEITDLNRQYLQAGQCQVERLNRGTAWLDTGTHASLLDAANFIAVLEKRQSLKIACPEEIAWRMGYIDDEQLQQLAIPQVKSGYGQYLLNLL